MSNDSPGINLIAAVLTAGLASAQDPGTIEGDARWVVKQYDAVLAELMLLEGEVEE